MNASPMKSFEQTAWLENAEMWRDQSVHSKAEFWDDVAAGKARAFAKDRTPATPGLDKIRADGRAEKAEAKILAVVTDRFMYVAQIAEKSGVTLQFARQAVLRLHKRGMLDQAPKLMNGRFAYRLAE